MDEEQWRDVPNYEGMYMVSNRGRVLSLRQEQNRTSRMGKPFTISYPEKILKTRNKVGWYRTCVLSKDNKQKSMLVHRLVATAFIPNKNNLPEVNHIDGNKENSDVSNLEWCSRSGNAKHMYDTGLIETPRGADRGNSVLTDDIVRDMRRVYSKGGIGYRKVADMFGCSMSTARNVVLGLSWTHVD